MRAATPRARRAAVPRVIPGAEAFRFDGGPVGVLLLHGFSGNPTSMRPLGEWLARRGLTVVGPRYPGHGTSWEDLATTRWQDWVGEAEGALDDLTGRCEDVVVVGLSVGGVIALHLAANRPEHVHGVAVINPYIRRRDLALAPLARVFARTHKGVGNDIKKPAQNEAPYERIAYSSITQLYRLQKTVQRELGSVRQPLLVFNSAEDHVTPKDNADYVLRNVRSSDKELVVLPNSYHVATLDYDAEVIERRVLEFVGSCTAGNGASRDTRRVVE